MSKGYIYHRDEIVLHTENVNLPLILGPMIKHGWELNRMGRSECGKNLFAVTFTKSSPETKITEGDEDDGVLIDEPLDTIPLTSRPIKLILTYRGKLK